MGYLHFYGVTFWGNFMELNGILYGGFFVSIFGTENNLCCTVCIWCRHHSYCCIVGGKCLYLGQSICGNFHCKNSVLVKVCQSFSSIQQNATYLIIVVCWYNRAVYFQFFYTNPLVLFWRYNHTDCLCNHWVKGSIHHGCITIIRWQLTFLQIRNLFPVVGGRH